MDALKQPLLTVDQALIDWIEYSSEPEKSASLTPSTAALIIFTSGSTGTPKGIVQEHRTYCSGAKYHGPALGFSKNSRVFQFASHSFDISLGDILTSLIHGGCIYIPSDEERMNDLPGAIRRLRANNVHLTPTVACTMEPNEVPGLEILTLGGEPLTRQAMDIWADSVNLIQAYGPAEACVDCTARQHVLKTDAKNELGWSVGCSIWIVNPYNHDELMPIGAEGEMLIEGPMVARGYLSDEAQTSKSFISDPKWVQRTWVKSGRRLYKTGDLGFIGSDGSIRILGRTDFQVKLRGQRIELGEIEYRLGVATGEQGKVAAAAITPKGGDKLIAAFVATSRAGDDNNDDKYGDSILVTSPKKLEEFREVMKDVKLELKQTLPPYMVPSVFIPLRDLPLSLSGKIDRKVLLALAERHTTEELNKYTDIVTENKEIIAPSTPEEEVLCRIWKDVLRMTEVSVDDNFFHLGGDSAKAMLLVSGLRKSGFTLTVADIIKFPVLRDQGPKFKQKVEIADVAPFSLLPGTTEDVMKIRKLAAKVCQVEDYLVEDIFPITEMQERFLVGAYLGSPGNKDWVQDARDSHDHARQLVFKVPASLNVPELMFAWKEVAQRHSILRTRFVQDEKNRIFQVVVNEHVESFFGYHDYSLEDFLQGYRAARMSWGMPLVGLTAAMDGTWCVLTISHAIYDGFSLEKLFKEVQRMFESPLPIEPGTQMNQFIKYLADGDREAAIEFWRRELWGADVKPIIPHHLLDCRTVQNVIRKATVELPGGLLPGAPNRATMIQVSAALMLANRLGCGDIIFDCHLSGRTGTLPGVGDLVGPTLTSLATRVHIGHDPRASVQEILRRTQDHMNRVVEHEHVGWWSLVQMEEFHDLLRGAPLLNVLPGREATGSGLGLELLRTIAHNEAPYGVMGTLVDKNKIELLVFSDRDCVSPEDVEEQLVQWQLVLRAVWNSCIWGDGELTVGDIALLLSW